MKILLVILFAIMILITSLGFTESISRFVFAGGSDSMMIMSECSLWIKFFLLLIFGVLLKYYSKYVTVFFIVFGFWFLSGRTLGFFPDGKIISGWFYFESDKINLCEENIDCENIMHYELRIEKLNFWRLKIKTNKVDKIIFIGPLVWINVLDDIHANYPDSFKIPNPD